MNDERQAGNTPADSEVVADVLAGDVEAFSLLVARYQRSVFNLARRMSGNRADAEDLAQEIFCKLYQNLHRYDPSRPLQNWLMRIASNHTLNWLAKREAPGVPIDPAGSEREGLPLDLPDGSPSPAELAERRETEAVVAAALAKLPPNFRLVFFLKYMEDYTAEEISGIVGAPRNTVKTWIFRARETLRGELGHLVRKPGGSLPEDER